MKTSFYVGLILGAAGSVAFMANGKIKKTMKNLRA